MGEYTTIIDGFPIKFPYENPYEIQIAYMKKVLECLEKKQHAILESPTGTGKTLSLLCATLGWISKQKEMKEALESRRLEDSDHQDDNSHEEEEEAAGAVNGNDVMSNGTQGSSNGLRNNLTDETIPMVDIPQVIFASRTHSQLTQAMRELKNSPYKDIKAAVFASRAQLCINPGVMKTSNALYKCRNLTKNNACKYRNNLYAKMGNPDYKKPILDIEDLGKLGEEHECCPFYASKEKYRDAEILFLPYNYLLDPKIRDICKIDLKNAIVIFDEAHNVEKACEQNACASITTTDLSNANRELDLVFQALDEIESNEESDENQEINRENVNDLQTRLLDLEGVISQSANSIKARSGGYLFELFQMAQITNENYKCFDQMMGNLIQFLCNKGYDAKGLKKTSEFLCVAFSSSAVELKNKLNECCIVWLEKNFMNATLHFWCLSPALRTKSLFSKEIRCLIMTSGTLVPDEIETEMEIPTPIKFTNKHIINPSQVFVNIVNKGKDDVLFDATYKNRSNESYLTSLGESLVDLCDSIPGGLLIFFPSYTVMNECHTFWRGRSGIWTKMTAKRDIYCEKQGESADKLEETRKKYYDSIDNKGGAIFMAVLRGKVSEGVDFIDMYGRAVVIVGIPFAYFLDTKIKSKMAYMDGRSKDSANRKVQSGSEWYILDAIKAVNQAIGRVIRHKDDYGAILLCDYRYNHCTKNELLSTWVRDNPTTNTFSDFQTMTEQLKAFFAQCERTLPKPKSKHQPVAVRLDFSDADDDEVQNTNANANGRSSRHHSNGQSSSTFAAYLEEEENSSDRNFIDDDSVSDEYSDSSYSGRNRKKPKKRQQRSPKKRAANGRKPSYKSPKKKFKKKASPSASESSCDQNTDDERFIDDGNSTSDSDFIDDESVDDQYSTSSSVRGVNTRSNRKRTMATRSTTLRNRKKTPVKRPTRNSPQPSTSYVRADSPEEENGNDSDEAVIKPKQARNGKSFKRIICISDSESDSPNTNEIENPILACFKRSLTTNQYKKLVEAFHEYNKNNGSYESYRDALFELFSGANEASNLMGMMLLLKFEHQSQFDEDIRRKCAE